MKFLRNLLGKDKSIDTYQDFWDWFAQHERSFFNVVAENGDFEKDFFDKVSPKLTQLRMACFSSVGCLTRTLPN
jgi:hypothetical protein